MNDEDTFFTAILATPPDNTVRLAFSDWLKERDDPRGEYLRAEVRWAISRGSGDEARVRQLGEALDPVWCARVSRPPVGVCCDNVRFSPHPKTKPVTSADLDRLEKRFAITLPADYRAFLLNYNGGEPSPNRLYISARMYSTDVADWVTALHGVYSEVDAPRFAEYALLNWNPDIVFCLQCLELNRNPAYAAPPDSMNHYWRGKPHRDLICVGYGDPNGQNEVYCLGFRGEQFGQVFYVAMRNWDMCEDGNCIPIADSFAEFLSLLTELRSSMKPRRKPKS
jgi:uncharacterized protein (TIGR02996 family)